IRSEVADLQMELAQVRAAPPPPDEIRSMIREQLVSRHAAAACGYRWERDALNVERLQLFAPDIAPWAPAMHPGGMITAWLLRLHGVDKMLEVFAAGVDDDAGGIPRAEKAERVAELETRIVEVELQECLLIEMAQQEGADILPPPTASPLA